MEDLIKKIIKVDKEARRKTEQSKKDLAESKIAIEERKKELEEHYNDSVEEIITLTTQEEEQKVAELKAALDEKFIKADQQLDKTFAENKDRWVNELYERVINNS